MAAAAASQEIKEGKQVLYTYALLSQNESWSSAREVELISATFSGPQGLEAMTPKMSVTRPRWLVRPASEPLSLGTYIASPGDQVFDVPQPSGFSFTFSSSPSPFSFGSSTRADRSRETLLALEASETTAPADKHLYRLDTLWLFGASMPVYSTSVEDLIRFARSKPPGSVGGIYRMTMKTVNRYTATSAPSQLIVGPQDIQRGYRLDEAGIRRELALRFAELKGGPSAAEFKRELEGKVAEPMLYPWGEFEASKARFYSAAAATAPRSERRAGAVESKSGLAAGVAAAETRVAQELLEMCRPLRRLEQQVAQEYRKQRELLRLAEEMGILTPANRTQLLSPSLCRQMARQHTLTHPRDTDLLRPLWEDDLPVLLSSPGLQGLD